MNFFGLTSLGPRSALGHSSVSTKQQRLQEVSDEQVLKAFDAFDDARDGTVARKHIRAVLDFLYQHPPPENEVALFTKYFDTHQSGHKNLKFFAAKNFSNRRISKAEFSAALSYVRQELTNEQSLAGDTNKAFVAPANPNAPTVVLTSLPTSSAAPYAYAPEAFTIAQPTQRFAAPPTAATLSKNLYNVEPVRGGKLAAAGAAVVAGGKSAAPAPAPVPAPAAAPAAAAPAAAASGSAAGARAAAAPGVVVPRLGVSATAPFATTSAAASGAAAAVPLTASARAAAASGAPAPPNAVEFKSGLHYREKMRKHTRLAFDPKDKFRVPVTSAHEYGWFEAIDAERVPVCPKNSCPETQFASEMVKSGIYF